MRNLSTFLLLSNNTGSFRTIQADRVDTSWMVAFISIYVLLIALIIGGNSLVVTAFFMTTKLRTKTNYFVVSLACTDLMVGLISVPMWIYYILPGDFSQFIDPSYKYFKSLDMVSGAASIMHLTCISAERCYAIVSPLKHRNLRFVYILLAICSSWALGLLSVILIEYVPWKKMPMLNTVVFFMVPLAIIIVAYTLIYITSRKSIREHQKKGIKKVRRTFRRRSELHIAYTVAMVTGIFVICWLPFFLVIITFTFCPTCSFVWDLHVLMSVKLLHYGNSGCNPIVYGVRNKRFNSAFKEILRRLCCRPKSSLYREQTRGMLLMAEMTQKSQVRTRCSLVDMEQNPYAINSRRRCIRDSK